MASTLAPLSKLQPLLPVPTSPTANSAANIAAQNVRRPAPHFALMVTGEVQAANLTSADRGLYLRHFMSYGADWLVISGAEEGISQTAFPATPYTFGTDLLSSDDFLFLASSSVSSSLTASGITLVPQHITFLTTSTVVWNLPFEIAWRTDNIYGWPQFAVAVYGPDFLGRDTIRGYGSCRFPREPGRHTVHIPLFVPVATSPFNAFLSWLLGTPPEFIDPLFVTKCKGRQATRVRSSGTIKVVFNSVIKDTEYFGLR